MSVVYNLFRGMLMVPRNTMEMMHRTLKSSMLNRDSGSTVLCRGECFAVLTLILLNHNNSAPPAQLSPQLYIAYSSAATCGFVRCRASPGSARCCLMLRVAFVRTYSSNRYMMRSTRHQVPVCTCFRTRLLAFFKFGYPLSVPMSPSPANYTRTADQSVTSPTRTQHSTVHSTGQLFIALHKQISVLSTR